MSRSRPPRSFAPAERRRWAADCDAGGRDADWFEGRKGADTFRFSGTAFGADRIAHLETGDDFRGLADFAAGCGCAALDRNNDDGFAEATLT